MVNVGTGTSGTRFLNKDWPVEEGLTAGTTKLASVSNLVPDETIIKENDRIGL